MDALAQKIYDECLQAPVGHLFTNNDLQDMVPRKDIEKLLAAVNELLAKGFLKALKQGDELVYKAIKQVEVDKINSMTADEAMVYSYIESSAREGIWTKTLKARTNLHQTVLTRCLKSLELQRNIKSIKSVKFPTRKIYMLYELTPSIEVTGGPWFTDAELDADFINELLVAINKYISSRSFPKQVTTSNNKAMGPKSFVPFSASYTGYPTLTEITTWVRNSNLTEVDLNDMDIKALLDVLVYDGKVEKCVGNTAYKAVRSREPTNGFTESPCGRCPVFDLCHEDGPVRADNCKYFAEWLKALD